MVRNYNPCSKNYRKLQPMRTTNTDTNYLINYDGLATLAGWLAGSLASWPRLQAHTYTHTDASYTYIYRDIDIDIDI